MEFSFNDKFNKIHIFLFLRVNIKNQFSIQFYDVSEMKIENDVQLENKYQKIYLNQSFQVQVKQNKQKFFV